MDYWKSRRELKSALTFKDQMFVPSCDRDHILIGILYDNVIVGILYDNVIMFTELRGDEDITVDFSDPF